MKMYWHYASWGGLPEMVESGNIRGSDVGAANENPFLWFSRNQLWEPTATELTFQEQAERIGCIRFGIASTDPRLLNWKNACSAAGIPTGMRQELVRDGRKKGGYPSDWYAVASNIPLDELHFQVWLNGWTTSISPQGMAAVWTWTNDWWHQHGKYAAAEIAINHWRKQNE